MDWAKRDLKEKRKKGGLFGRDRENDPEEPVLLPRGNAVAIDLDGELNLPAEAPALDLHGEDLAALALGITGRQGGLALA